MIKKRSSHSKINSLIERFFIISGFVILIATLSVGLYFNKYDEQEKLKTNLQKIHSMLSQLIVPSLIISDLSEVKRLLYMASGNEETFLIIDNDGIVIMPDYGKSEFSNFISNSYKSINDCKNLEAIYRYIGDKKYLINCSVLKSNDVFSGEKNVGALLSFTSYKWFSFSSIIFYFVGILIVLFVLLIFLFRKMLYRKLLQPLVTLKNNISEIPMTNAMPAQIDEISNAPAEIVEIKDTFDRLLLSLKEEYNGRVEAEKMRALIDLAAGVAHDIRSPLIALDIIIKDIKNIPEEQRIVIRNSASRINDIANNLLTQYKQRKNLESDEDAISDIQPELISDLLTSLISEKRVQYRNDTKKLMMNLEENAYGKFALISSSTFNRVLSNIIDNSIEASSDQIKIRLSILNMEHEQTDVLLQIQDNGCGIESKVLKKIIDGENFSSKEKGHGLGLPHAIKTVEKEWGGKFNIKSSVSIGTTVEILLPQTVTPKWFLSKLMVNPKENIFILDDDESIHQVWEKRFNEVNSEFKFVNHYNPQDLLAYDKSRLASINLFLIDYEFIGCNENGLDIIEKLNIADRSYLVTSRHEESYVRERCEKIGLKIIPKTFAVYIPIVVSKQNIKSADLIFIDDDIAITDAWRLHGLTKGKMVATYNSIRAFKIDAYQYDLSTPVYIDSDLNDTIKGQEYAKELYEIGFKCIYLATGYASNNFHSMPWIKEIVGKEPPF